MPIENIYRGIPRPRAEGFATLVDFAGSFLQNREDREARKDREAARALQQQDRQLRGQEIALRGQTIEAQTRKLKTDEEKLAATQALIQQHTGPDGLVDYEAVSNGLGAIDLDAKAELDKHLEERAAAKRRAELDKLAQQKTEIDLRKSQLEADATDVKTWLERYAAIKQPEQQAEFWQDVSESKMLGKLRTAGLSTNSTPEDAAGLILGAKGRADLAAKQANDAPSSDYGRFETDFVKAEADKLKKPIQALTPAELVKIKTAARKAFGQADDAARRPLAPIVIQTPGGFATVNRDTNTATPITQGGAQVPLPPTTDQRNRTSGRSSALDVLDSIDELSARINTGVGALAKISGAVEKAKAQANLNDDVSEYEAVISGFTPLLARALGHTGVLTEQDVQSVKDLYPKTTDSKTVRDRKIARIRKIMGEMGAGSTAAPAPTEPRVNPFRK